MPGAEREAASRRAGGWQGPRGRWQRSDPAGTQDGYGARGRSGPGPGLGAQHPSARASQSQHPSARASQSQRAWGRGGGKRAIKSRTSVKRHFLDAPQKEKLHVSCAREGSEPLAQAPPASNQPPPPPPL